MGGKHIGRQRRVLSFDEVNALLAWLPNMHQNAQDAITLYLWTAMRGGEILGARADQFTTENGILWWTVQKQFTKNARHADAVDLRVPLFGRAKQIIQRRKANVGQTGWLFEDSHGKQYTQHHLSTYVYVLQPYSKKAQRRPERMPIVGWSPHNLRRTARTFLAQLGCPNEIGEAIVGHMPTEIVGTYNTYTYDAERVIWLKRLSDYLESTSADALPARPKPLAATGNSSEMGRSLPHAANSSTSHAVRPLLS